MSELLGIDGGSHNHKPEIRYPCEWEYKIIGAGEDLIREAIRDVVQERTCVVSFSNRSRQGKYVCLNLELIVLNEGDRTSIYESLKEHPSVRMVL